jgi:hypothetical protein
MAAVLGNTFEGFGDTPKAALWQAEFGASA